MSLPIGRPQLSWRHPEAAGGKTSHPKRSRAKDNFWPDSANDALSRARGRCGDEVSRWSTSPCKLQWQARRVGCSP